LKHGFGGNHSLCHGDLGNLETLLHASRAELEPRLANRIERLSAAVLAGIDRHGWLCGLPLPVESQGLMTGIAGVGYQLLRLAEPARVPSVLALEPPPDSVSEEKPGCCARFAISL
jgi:lantibiotic modifying enzyme